MDAVSTSRTQFLTDLAELRTLRKRCLVGAWLAIVAFVLCLAGAALASIAPALLAFAPLAILRLRLMKLFAARCPRCDEHFFSKLRGPRSGWRIATLFDLFDRDLRCAHCDLTL